VPRDTSDEAARQQLEAQRRLGEAGRIRIAIDMSLTARALAAARLRRDHPEWSEADVTRQLLRYAFAPGNLPPGFG